MDSQVDAENSFAWYSQNHHPNFWFFGMCQTKMMQGLEWFKIRQSLAHVHHRRVSEGDRLSGVCVTSLGSFHWESLRMREYRHNSYSTRVQQRAGQEISLRQIDADTRSPTTIFKSMQSTWSYCAWTKSTEDRGRGKALVMPTPPRPTDHAVLTTKIKIRKSIWPNNKESET